MNFNGDDILLHLLFFIFKVSTFIIISYLLISN